MAINLGIAVEHATADRNFPGPNPSALSFWQMIDRSSPDIRFDSFNKTKKRSVLFKAQWSSQDDILVFSFTFF